MILVENYYKFLSKRTKFHKSPDLNLDHYGFIRIDCSEKENEKTRDIIKQIIKIHQIKRGHIVFRYTQGGWGIPYITIYYNRRILDKYGNKITQMLKVKRKNK